MDAPTLEALRTVAGAAIVVSVLVFLLFQTLGATATDAFRGQFGPIISVALGIVVVLLATYTLVDGVGKQDVASGILNGIFAGLSAMGIHDFGSKTIVKSLNGTYS